MCEGDLILVSFTQTLQGCPTRLRTVLSAVLILSTPAMPMTLNFATSLHQTLTFQHGSQHVWQTPQHGWQLKLNLDRNDLPGDVTLCRVPVISPSWTTLRSHHLSLHAILG